MAQLETEYHAGRAPRSAPEDELSKFFENLNSKPSNMVMYVHMYAGNSSTGIGQSIRWKYETLNADHMASQ